MASPIVTLNGLRCVSARFVFPLTGVWFADLDIDPDALASSVPTSGPATVSIGTTPAQALVGVVDPLAAGSFGPVLRVRVLGGAGGWQKGVPAQHFHSDGGLTTEIIYSTTGALVQELVTVVEPTLLGPDYVRTAGPASRIFEDEAWYVDPLTATTFVGPRPPAIPDVSLQVLTWDPLTKSAEVACDALILPGTPLVDTRIGESPVIVADVEQTFDASGSRATCWTSPALMPASRLRVALQTMIRELGKRAILEVKLYRFVEVAGSPTMMALQAVDRDPLTGAAAPWPDLIPVTQWTGFPGATATLPPALEVLVALVDGAPVVLGYSTLELPLTSTVDASVSLEIGPTAPTVSIGSPAAALPVAQAAPLAALVASACIAAVGGATPGDGGAAAFAAFASAMAAGVAAFTTKIAKAA